jgi:hypothetical protein
LAARGRRRRRRRRRSEEQIAGGSSDGADLERSREREEGKGTKKRGATSADHRHVGATSVCHVRTRPADVAPAFNAETVLLPFVHVGATSICHVRTLPADVAATF